MTLCFFLWSTCAAEPDVIAPIVPAVSRFEAFGDDVNRGRKSSTDV